jgi:hypothetical protein
MLLARVIFMSAQLIHGSARDAVVPNTRLRSLHNLDAMALETSVPESALLAQLEAARYVLCSRHCSWAGEWSTTIRPMDANRDAVGVELAADCYEAVMAYCEAHPHKWATFDGCCLHYPRNADEPLAP